MSIRKWQIMDLLLDVGDITAYELVNECGIEHKNAMMMLLRTHKQGWLTRRKIRDDDDVIVYVYQLSDKALRFLDDFGSFIDHKWFH